MAKLLKKYLRSEVEELLSERDGAVVVHYQGLSSSEEYKFRKTLREKDALLTVVKASIVRVYCRDHEFTGAVKTVFKGPVALVTSQSGASTPALAKTMLDLTKEFKKVSVQGAIYDGDVVPSKDVDALSKMPTREQLLSRLAGAFQGPPRNFASAIYAINAKFASVLAALQSKREQEEGGA